MRVFRNLAIWGALAVVSLLMLLVVFAPGEEPAQTEAAAVDAAQAVPEEEQPTYSAYKQGLLGGAGADRRRAKQNEVIIPANLSPEEKALIERGRYLAVAADCGACHTARGAGDKPFAGDYIFKFAMGQIVAANITPSKQFGIGAWSEAEFARAVRAGVRPGGTHLYPAMPYTEYSVMTDADIHALYAYFMLGVAPADDTPKQKTKLNFPFNLPGAMFFWNALFLNDKRFEPDPSATAQINRGRYLVDGPAHCGTCHTPRNFMLASNAKQYLAGSVVNGWWAPNITSDPVGGLGGWSRQEIVTYLKTGHIRDKSQANGPMAEAVELSFRHFSDADLQAMAAYLQTVPPLPTIGQTAPAYAAHQPKDGSFTQYEVPAAPADSAAASLADTVNGAVLYNAACAACHGANGEGAADGSSPSLLRNRAVGIANPYSLIMTVAYGLQRQGADREYSMPGFFYATNPIHAAMNEEQIAAVVTYVRTNFGGSAEQTTAKTVRMTLAGGKMPFLIEHAALFAVLGGGVVLLALLWLIRRFLLRYRRREAKAAHSEIAGRAEALKDQAAAMAQGLKDKAKTAEAEAKAAAAKLSDVKRKAEAAVKGEIGSGKAKPKPAAKTGKAKAAKGKSPAPKKKPSAKRKK